MPSGRPEIVDRLRKATGELHRDIERATAVLDGGRERYVWFVAKQYGFHAAIEPRLAETLGSLSLAAPLDLDRRRRAHLFAADLLHFEIHPGRLPRCAALPRVDSTARALGALYVLEGSTLGGAFLLAQLGRTLGVAPGSGASGIAPYGPGLFGMWIAYADALDRFVREHPGDEGELIDAARETFERLIEWMREPAEAALAAASA